MNWMVNSRRMRAAEGLYKKSPRLHGDARGKERFCPNGRASRRCTHMALWESKRISHTAPVWYQTWSHSSPQTRLLSVNNEDKLTFLTSTHLQVRGQEQFAQIPISNELSYCYSKRKIIDFMFLFPTFAILLPSFSPTHDPHDHKVKWANWLFT